MMKFQGIDDEPKVLDPSKHFVNLKEVVEVNRIARMKAKMARWSFIIALVAFTMGLIFGMYYGITCPSNRVEAIAVQRVPVLEKQVAELEHDKVVLMKSLFDKEKSVKMTASVR